MWKDQYEVYGGLWKWPQSLWHRLFGHTCTHDHTYGPDWIGMRCCGCWTSWREEFVDDDDA